MIMTTIEAKIPEPVLKQAEELAEREQISLEQLISLAVTQCAPMNRHCAPPELSSFGVMMVL